jgi:hypothetical protein
MKAMLSVFCQVEEAQEWTDLFGRSASWFGGDGIFAIPLNG